MTRKKLLVILLIAGLVSVFCVEQALSQDGGRGGRGRNRDGDQQQDRTQMREQWQARQTQRLREQIGATEEEWTTLAPLVENVQNVQRQLQFGMMGAFGGRGGRAAQPTGEGEAAPEQTDLQKAAQALREVAANEAASDKEVTDAMETYRTAKAAVEAELVTAKEALAAAVTVRQQAQLVLMGLLD